VYRALEFLERNGFVHRIPSLQAYVLCAADHKHQDHGTQFLLCDQCQSVTEIHLCSMPKTLADEAKSVYFTPAAWTLEIKGICGRCSG
jgi:Fur family zinc uptake transcriptional regulator